MAGRIQNEDIKSLAEITGAGGTKSQLPNDSKQYVSAFSRDKTLQEVLLQKLLGGSPLKMHAHLTPDSKLYIDAGTIDTLEGTAQTIPPINNQIPAVPASTIDFQTGATTGAPFTIAFPVSVVGQFRRLGFTLLSTGTISCLFSPEAATVGALANPGTVFIAGGLPIGYIDLECTQASPGRFKTAGSATNIIENVVSSNFRIFAFGSGGGAGGSGDANEILERMKEAFESSLHGFMTPTIIKTDGLTLIDEANSTGSQDFTDNTYQIDSGEILRSVQFLDPDFLNDGRDVAVADLTVYWKLANLDPAAVYQLSRDGGVNFQTVTMARVSETDAVTGRLVFAADANSNLDTYAVANADANIELTDTGSNLQLAIPVVTTAAKVFRSLEVYLNKLGTPSGFVTLSLIKDNAGQPSTSLVDVAVYSAAYDISALSAGNNTLTAPISDTPLAAGTYYLTVTTDSTYAASFVAGVNSLRLRADTSAPTGEVLRQYNGTVWANIAATSGTYATFGRPLDLRVKITSALAGAKVAAFDVRFDLSGSIVSGILEQQTYAIAAGANTNSFPLSFVPNPKTLKVYWVETGKVFTHPAFDINGQNVVFAANTFNDPLNIITLKFDQSQGGAFDTSDVNATAIATHTNQLVAMGEQFDELKLVAPPKIAVPFTTVINRAAIPDPANDLAVRFGVERIMTQGLFDIQNEVGPAGERVFGVLNDTKGIIRCVGSWFNSTTPQGQILEGIINNYVEVTFYGTGLNILTLTNGVDQNWKVSIDGGAFGADIFPNFSPVLVNRNYSNNILLSLVSGLALGVHTVIVRNDGAAIFFTGFEIVNDSSTLKVNPGSYYYNSGKLTLATQQSPAYNSGFESGTLGTRGGHVVTYLKSDGTVGKAVTPTDAAQLNMASANHANEEVIRTYSYREFGAGRADDFSRLDASAISCAFTLDDGTTSLTGQNARGESGLYPNASGDFVTLTFVGTGLDIIEGFNNVTINTTYTPSIDNVNIATNIVFYTGVAGTRVKVVSGLPYGTHVFKFLRTSAGTGTGTIRAFVVYGPKKPTLPVGAVELADYYIMGNYTASTTETIDAPAPGSLRKMNTREINYVGTWGVAAVSPLNVAGGFQISSTTLNSYAEYSFFGTGFEYRVNSESNQTQTVRLDGSITNYTAAGITNSFVGAGATWTPTTGAITGNGGVGSVLCISGLTLGWHVVRITLSATSGGGMFFESLDIITPVHSPKPNLYGDYQNSLTVGNCAISDNRKTQLLPLNTAKAWSQAVGVTSSPTTTSTTALPVPDMSITLKTNGGNIEVFYGIEFTLSGVFTGFFAIFIDGVQSIYNRAQTVSASANNTNVYESQIIPVGAGTHKIDMYWNTNGGTMTAIGTRRLLKAREI